MQQWWGSGDDVYMPPFTMKRVNIDVGRDGMCLAVDKGWVAGAKVVLRKCNENDVNQKFDDRLKLTEIEGS
jgi:hypothetical protein